MSLLEKCGSGSWKLLRLMLLTFLFIPSFSGQMIRTEVTETGDCVSGNHWELLTEKNFTSQVKHHSHVLVLVTVPWSGKSRSLMKELYNTVNCEGGKYASLKLRVVYKNSQKNLADALGATDEATLLYYHRSVPYKCHGKFRAHNVLSSVLHAISSSSPDEFPVKTLKTPKAVKKFIGSTDHAIILSEFCGWTSKLLAEQNAGPANQTGNELKVEDEYVDTNCGDVSMSGGSCFLDTRRYSVMGNVSRVDSPAGFCSVESFREFKSFFLRFMSASREYSLPPERCRFGRVRDRSIFASMGIPVFASWLAVSYPDGRFTRPRILKDEGELNDSLTNSRQLVARLDGDTLDLGSADGPSMLLFIDRSSSSSKVRRKSKEALNSFRDFAGRHPSPGDAAVPRMRRILNLNNDQSFSLTDVISDIQRQMSSHGFQILPQGGEVINVLSWSGHHNAGVDEKREPVRSFLFIDGGSDHLLSSLIGSSSAALPLLVIFDPAGERHYVLPVGSDVEFSSLLRYHANGSYEPYRRSSSPSLPTRRNRARPPFVNLDFRDPDPIPPLSLQQLSAAGVRKGSLVFFTTTWCGFCHRTELIVREVLRAFTTFEPILKKQNASSGDAPLIYSIDCTLNDCGPVLQRHGQSDGYPSLVLFPNEGGDAVAYNGHVSVAGVIRFLADHGSQFAKLFLEMCASGLIENPRLCGVARGGAGEEVGANEDVGRGSILVATDVVKGAGLFENSRVLIVRADRVSGFQGLILNSRLGSWDDISGVPDADRLRQCRISRGGPVVDRFNPLVTLVTADGGGLPGWTEVLPGIFFVGPSDTAAEIQRVRSMSANQSCSGHWFFLGYSGWDSNQLVRELSAGAWRVIHGNTMHHFQLLQSSSHRDQNDNETSTSNN